MPTALAGPVSLPRITAHAWLARQSRSYLRASNAARAGQPRGVHRARVAARRLRLALRLLALRPEAARVRRAERGLKRVLRASSQDRDAHIALTLLGTLLAHPKPAERRLLARLRRTRQRSRQALEVAFARRPVRRVRRRVRRAARVPVLELAQVCRRVDAYVEEQGRALADAIDALGMQLAPRRLHALRIGCRRLRYVGELLGALTGQRFAVVDALAGLQACLGELQDAHVLARRLRREARREPLDRAASTALRRAQARARATVRAQHERYLRQAPAALLARACAELRAACARVGRDRA
jgi:CHAD domain-containing protein